MLVLSGLADVRPLRKGSQSLVVGVDDVISRECIAIAGEVTPDATIQTNVRRLKDHKAAKKSLEDSV